MSRITDGPVLADIYDAVASPPVILVNERKALKRCHVTCNMKSIMSRVAESTEQAVRKHLAGITLDHLVRKVRRAEMLCIAHFQRRIFFDSRHELLL